MREMVEEDGLRVVATRWERGWDLTLDEGNVTSVASLKNAEQQVRDYLDTRYPDEDHSQTSISVEVDLGGFEEAIARAQADSRRAAIEQEKAAAQIRGIAQQLKEKGFSSDDTATLLGVSRSRVYQLLAA